MICDEDPLRRRPRESTARRKRQERCVWMARKMTEWPSKRGSDYQNHAIGWLHRGYSSLGGGKVVRFPRIWMVYGECRVRFDDLVLPESANARPGRLDPDTVDILEALAREVREEQAEKADAHNMSRRQFMEATCLASLAAPGALQSALAGEGDGTIPKKNKIDSPATQQASGLDYARLFKPLKELAPNYAPADALGIIR